MSLFNNQFPYLPNIYYQNVLDFIHIGNNIS